VTSDDHAGLVNAIAAVLPGAAGQHLFAEVVGYPRRAQW